MKNNYNNPSMLYSKFLLGLIFFISNINITFSQDVIPPIAVCDEHTVVSIGAAGQAAVPASTFDDGSTDNVGIVLMEARRMDNPACPGFDESPFGAFVPFYCCDVNTTVMVELRVSDAAGNMNSCMVEVDVEDKLAPVIVCPSDKTISCSDSTQPSFTGEATATDNCSTPTITHQDISNTIGDCGAGVITRLWVATDAQGQTASCIQLITTEYDDPFTITDTECRTFPLGAQHSLTDGVEWSCDLTLTTCGVGLTPAELIAAGVDPRDARPQIFEGACENIASTYQDQILEFGAADACLKILRKWMLVDWCQASSNQDPTQPGPGVWHYTQVIKVENSTAPVVTDFTGDDVVENYEENCGSTFAAFEIEIDDDCTAFADLDISWAFSSGETGAGVSASGAFLNGNYSLTFTINDQCGNITTYTHDFEVKDFKKPTPVCTFGISTVLMPSSGEVMVAATDFENGSSYDNCTAYSDLKFSFSENVNEDSLLITCTDIPSDGLVPISIYATDEVGNFDYCATFVKVEYAPGVCDSPPQHIAGTIFDEDDVPIEDVTVTIEDLNSGDIFYSETDQEGEYEFSFLSNGFYKITPEKDFNYLNGVTTYDLVLIPKHILGVEILDSPYKMIAADANHSETITTLDIVKLRALILHIDDELADNTSWRFVDANYVFQNPNNALAEDFPEEVIIEGWGWANFIAVKIGDVNGSASPNNLMDGDTRDKDGSLVFQIKNQKIISNEKITVDFKAKDFKQIEGFQFTLDFDTENLDFIDITTYLQNLEIDNFGFEKIEEGVITSSWHQAEGVSLEDETILFSLNFKAKKSGELKDLIQINSRYTDAEAYQNSGLLEVVLDFDENKKSSGVVLLQNVPNPFDEVTQILFELSNSENVTLRIYDVMGRVLEKIKIEATEGLNTYEVKKSDLETSGLLYYQLETMTETFTKKMILE